MFTLILISEVFFRQTSRELFDRFHSDFFEFPAR